MNILDGMTQSQKNVVMMDFFVNLYGLTSVKSVCVPLYIQRELNEAKTPEEVEDIIGNYEPELAKLLDPANEFLVCDSATELMAAVLESKGIKCRIECGINDYGDSHSYVVVNSVRYDPTQQGYGDNFNPSSNLSRFLHNALLTKKLVRRLRYDYGCGPHWWLGWELGYGNQNESPSPQVE